MLKSLTAVSLLLAATFTAAAQPAPSAEAVKDLAPTGSLRAAINFGNSVLAQKAQDGSPAGVSADLSRELAKRLNVPIEFVTFEAAGKVFEGAAEGAWDIGFVAIEPARAKAIEFTAPYVIIEGTYMVRNESPLVGTGMELRAAVDAGDVIITEKTGVVEEISADYVTVMADDGSRASATAYR